MLWPVPVYLEQRLAVHKEQVIQHPNLCNPCFSAPRGWRSMRERKQRRMLRTHRDLRVPRIAVRRVPYHFVEHLVQHKHVSQWLSVLRAIACRSANRTV